MTNKHIITKENVQIWLDSKDKMLVEIANSCIGNPLPTERELTEILKFFNVFSLGFKEMGEEELSNLYAKRANIFVAGLGQLGLKPGYYKNYVRNAMMPGMRERIIRHGCSWAAYLMLDLSREIKKKEKE